MDDLIDRAAVLDALGERPMLWINNDEYTLGARNQYDMDRLAIETVPSIDAVPVVRCKDCKHNPKLEWFGCPMASLSEKQRPETAWCWKAERRTNERSD